jgi:hypothetical protein
MLQVDAQDGTISVPDSALVAIAVAAAERVEGVHVLRRRSVGLEPPLVRLSLSARRSGSLRTLGEATVEAVADAFQAMCGLDVRVEITIAEFA